MAAADGPTHILVSHASQRFAELYRAEDGVRLGQLKDITVIFGENPNRCEGRAFIDNDAANAWIRTELPARDLKERKLDYPVNLEVRDMDVAREKAMLWTPEEDLQLPGGLRSLKN